MCRTDTIKNNNRFLSDTGQCDLDLQEGKYHIGERSEDARHNKFQQFFIFHGDPSFLLVLLCIGLITGLIAHRLGHISTEKDNARVLKWTIAAAAGGLLFNVCGIAAGQCDLDLQEGKYHIGERSEDARLVWS